MAVLALQIPVVDNALLAIGKEATLTGRTVILLNYMNGQDYPLERLPQHVVDALEVTEPGASQKNIVRMSRARRCGSATRSSMV